MNEQAPSKESPCLICGKTDGDKAMVYRGEDWCSEGHRKQIQEVAPGTPELRGEGDGGNG